MRGARLGTVVILVSVVGEMVKFERRLSLRKARRLYRTMADTLGHPCEDPIRAVALYGPEDRLIAFSTYYEAEREEHGKMIPAHRLGVGQ